MLQQLTEQERQILELLYTKQSNKQIAHSFGISIPRLQVIIHSIANKHEVADRIDLMALKIQELRLYNSQQ